MGTVLQLTRKLNTCPTEVVVPGVSLRHYVGPADATVWLELRRRAFARQQLGVGHWDAGDFEREFLQKPWWRPQAMWFADSQPESAHPQPAAPMVVGTVTLAWRGMPPTARPVVHWLAVLPSYRRRGVGRLLLAALERAAWDAGHRQIWLETHSRWLEAGHLYAAAGYAADTETHPSSCGTV